MRSRWGTVGLCLLIVSAAVGCGQHRGLPSGASAGRRSGNAAGSGKDAGGSADAEPSTAGHSAPKPGGDGGALTGLDFQAIGKPEVIASSFSLAESPNWDHCTDSLLFVDVDRSLIHQLKDGEISEFMTDSNCTNGMAFDAQGNLLMAQMGCGQGGKVVRRDRDGSVTVLADTGTMGAALHTPDDLAVRSDGTIYFSDGDFPHATYVGNLFNLILPLPIYRIAPDGTLFREGSTSGPNGIELSPDEQTLYVSSYIGGQLLKFTPAEDGALTAAGSLVTGVVTPDSLCLDVEGNVYLGVATGLLVMSPDGTQLGTIAMQTAKGGPTSCGFGGADGKTLFVTAWTTLYKIENMPFAGLGWSIDEKFPCP
jgi:gluconolactonase